MKKFLHMLSLLVLVLFLTGVTAVCIYSQDIWLACASDKEVGMDAYRHIVQIKNEYPNLRYTIQGCLDNDGRISWGEYKIILKDAKNEELTRIKDSLCATCKN